MLKGKALGNVAAEVEKDRAAAELAKETARVKRVVEDILGGIGVFDKRIAEANKMLVELSKGRVKLQEQLDRIKAGDADAVAAPAETWPTPRHWANFRDNAAEDRRMQEYLRDHGFGPRHPGFYRW